MHRCRPHVANNYIYVNIKKSNHMEKIMEVHIKQSFSFYYGEIWEDSVHVFSLIILI